MTTVETLSKAQKNSDNSCEEKQESSRKWIFNVEIEDILPYEVVILTGGCAALGNWSPKDGVTMNYENDNKKWKIEIEIPFKEKLFYRYFIGVLNNKKIYIRKWEAHHKPRVIHKNDTKKETQDKFGLIENVKILQRGWLTTETILQFKLFNKSLIINEELASKKISIKVTPKRFKYSKGLPQDENNSPLLFDPDPKEVLTEVVKFVYAESVLRPQSEFGMLFDCNDIVIYHITVSELKQFAFLFEIFFRTDSGEVQFLGSQYIMPYDLKTTEGRLELPIINSINCPLGVLIINYLLVTPLPYSIPDMKTSYVKQWKNDSTQLNIGHRGCGVSFRSQQSHEIENTIASFKRAGQNGADMIEFDVQLTKELIPIVFHDFEINISLNTGTPSKNIKDFLEIQLKDLTLSQLHSSQMYYIQSGQVWKYPRKTGDQQICPTLEQLFDTIDPNLALDIEIKWPQERIGSKWEGKLHTIDKNEYVNRILDVILRKAFGRCLMLSSFDADICTMLRLKQNIYPVVFLALGLSERYPKYKDIRCNIYELSICNAQAMELVGVGPHSEDFVKDPFLVKLIKNLDMLCFCWGDDSRDKATFQKLKDMGINGIVCDRVDLLSAKTDTGKFPKETNDSFLNVY